MKLDSKKGRPQKLSKSKAVELIKQQLEQTGKVNAKEVAEATGYHPVHIRRLVKQVEKQIKYPETEKPIAEGETVTPTVTVETAKAEEIPLTPEEQAEGIVTEAIEKGEWNEEDLFSLFDSVNMLFPERHRRDDKATRAVAKAWVKPFNRMMEKYADADLYIALAVTAMYFAPPIISIVRERATKKKEAEKIAAGGTRESEKQTGKTEFGKQLYQPT